MPNTDGVDRLAEEFAPSSTSRGFTLIEIVVVIVVIAVLASLVAPNVFQHVGEANARTIVSVMDLNGFQRGGTFTDAQGRPTPDVVHFQIKPPSSMSDRRAAARRVEAYFNNCVKGVE